MDNLTEGAILDFLANAGQRLTSPQRLLLLGGGALILLGSLRPTQDIDYLGDDLHKDDFQRFLEAVADEYHLGVEAVPLDRFVPFPPDSETRHIFIRRFDRLDVFILDPYAIALSKIDRGFDTDIDDVVFLVRRGLIGIDRLAALLESSLQRAIEYDLNPPQARIHLDLVRRRLVER